jgi:hypothetical protein
MCGFDFLPAGRAGYTHKRTVSSFGFIVVHIVTLHAVTCIGAAEDEGGIEHRYLMAERAAQEAAQRY